MRDRVLVKQFKDDAGVAFLEVIRRAGDPIRTQEIKAELIEAGVAKPEVDRWWKTLQPVLKAHPQVTAPRSGIYEWSPNPEARHDSLEKLAGQASKRSAGRAWLVEALKDNVGDGLAKAETTGSRASLSWSQQREREKATLVAEIVAAAALLASEGGSSAEVLEQLAVVAQDHRLSAVGQVGEEVEFDRNRHEPSGSSQPRAGQTVRIRQPGFVWSGGGPEGVVVVRALVGES